MANSHTRFKANPLTPSYALVLEELKEAVENMKLVADGKLNPRLVEDLLKINFKFKLPH